MGLIGMEFAVDVVFVGVIAAVVALNVIYLFICSGIASVDWTWPKPERLNVLGESK